MSMIIFITNYGENINIIKKSAKIFTWYKKQPTSKYR